MQQHGTHSEPDLVISLLRRLSAGLMAPLLVLPFLALPILALPLVLAPAAALADNAAATEAEMNLYTRIAAVNVCIARGAGVPESASSSRCSMVFSGSCQGTR